MISSVTKLVLIGAGLAIAAGVAYFIYQNLSSDTLSGQLARSRLGLDKAPPAVNLLRNQSEYAKPLSEQPKSDFEKWVDELVYNTTGKPRPGSVNAAYYYYSNLADEEEKYKQPWALRR
jgi:hypothetical protein